MANVWLLNETIIELLTDNYLSENFEHDTILPLFIIIQHIWKLYSFRSERLNQFQSQLKHHSENNDHNQGYICRAFTTVSRSSHGPNLRGTGYYSRVGPSLVTVQTRGVDWQRNRWHWVSHYGHGGSWRRWWEVVVVTHVGGTAPWSAIDHCMPLVRESCVLEIANMIGIGLVANKVQTTLLVQIEDLLATAFSDEQFHVKALIPASCTCHGLKVCQTIVKRTVRWTLMAGKSFNWKQTNICAFTCQSSFMFYQPHLRARSPCFCSGLRLMVSLDIRIRISYFG